MKIKEGYVLREVAGQGIVIATGEASKSFHGMVKLNSTGSLIWKSVEEGLSKEQIVDKLAELYGIERETASVDVDEMINKMKEAGFVIE